MVRRNEGTDTPARKRRPGSTRKPRAASPAGLAAAPLPLPGTDPAGPGGDAGPAADTGAGAGLFAPEAVPEPVAGRGLDRVEPELQALAAEIGAEFPEAGAIEQEPGAGPSAAPVDLTAAFRPVITNMTRAAGLMLERYDRDPFSDAEADLAATALLELGRVYDVLDPSSMDPRTAAWFNLGVTALALAAPRMKRRGQTAPESGAQHGVAA